MKFPRRQLLHLAAGAAALPAISRVGRAQTYPHKLIKLILPFLAGTPNDVIARLIAAETDKWGKVIRAANIKAE